MIPHPPHTYDYVTIPAVPDAPLTGIERLRSLLRSRYSKRNPLQFKWCMVWTNGDKTYTNNLGWLLKNMGVGDKLLAGPDRATRLAAWWED